VKRELKIYTSLEDREGTNYNVGSLATYNEIWKLFMKEGVPIQGVPLYQSPLAINTNDEEDLLFKMVVEADPRLNC
jgi:hypothetical protein